MTTKLQKGKGDQPETEGISMLSKHGEEGEALSPDISNSRQMEPPLPISYNPQRHLWILSFAFFFIFNSYNALEALQSSLNSKAGLGLYSLITLYATNMLSSFFASPIIHRLTVKRSLLLSWCTHILFVASNYYPEYWTLIPASFLLGFATSIVWTCQGLYVSRFALQAARQGKESHVTMLSRFSGHFFMMHSITPIVGNLLSALLFTIPASSEKESNFTFSDTAYNFNSSYNRSLSVSLYDSTNYTLYPENEGKQCGPYFCISRDISEARGTPSVAAQTRYILISVFLFFDLLGLALTLVLVNLPSSPKLGEKGGCIREVCGGIRFLPNRKFLLLMPSYVVEMGLRAVMSGIYTKGFITCTTNIRMVSFAMLWFGLVMIVCSITSGYLGKYLHRNWHFAAGFAGSLSFCVMTLCWDPTRTHTVFLFIPPALIGIAEAILVTQLNALMGLMYEGRKEAFSMRALVTSAANCSAYVMCTFLCYKYIMFVSLVFVAIAVVCYTLLAFTLRKESRNRRNFANKTVYQNDSDKVVTPRD